MRPRAASRTLRAARPVVCSAQAQEAGKQVGTAAAAAALAAVLSLGSVEPAYADISGLTPCAESKAFAKVKKNEIKGLQKRLKLYEPDSAPALALQATIEKTERRFDNYAKQGLLCGTDGLPHLISDPGFALKYGHAGDVFVRGFLVVPQHTITPPTTDPHLPVSVLCRLDRPLWPQVPAGHQGDGQAH